MSGPPTTCGCNAPRVTPAPRCTNCGRYSHLVGDGYKVGPDEDLVTEAVFRRWARKMAAQVPQLSGSVVREDET